MNWFEYKLSDKILRTMNKAEYKAAMSWLRLCRRVVMKELSE